jgi:hypothetical protein
MATSNGSERATGVARLYELWTLDVVTDLGAACGSVFERHPQQFKNVGGTTADALAVLRYVTGSDDEHLDADQRTELCTPLLGESDGARHADAASAFHQVAAGLRQAAVDAVQRSFDTGDQQLRTAFRDAVKSFHAYLTVMEGAVTASAVRRLVSHFDEVVGVLQDANFSGGLGLPPAPADPWPRFGEVGGDGAALIEAIDREASNVGLTTRVPLDQAEFVAVQRIADHGATTIDGIFADPSLPDSGDVDTAIDVTYRWWTAIRDFRGGE